eukprot:scaffold34398_cov51-Attheya_sp.AAC.2
MPTARDTTAATMRICTVASSKVSTNSCQKDLRGDSGIELQPKAARRASAEEVAIPWSACDSSSATRPCRPPICWDLRLWRFFSSICGWLMELSSSSSAPALSSISHGDSE